MIDRLTKKKELDWFKDNMNLKTLNIDKFSDQEIISKLSVIGSDFNKNVYDSFIHKFLREKNNNSEQVESKAQLIIDKIINHH